MSWEPREDLRFKLSFDYTQSNENGVAYQNVEINENAVFSATVSVHVGCPGATFPPPHVPLIDDPRCANDFLIGEFGTNNGTNRTASELESWGIAFQMDYDLSEMVSLKSVTSYRKLAWLGFRDPDGTPFPSLHTQYDSDGDQLSEELQLLFEGERWSGVVGFYYFDEEVVDIPTITLAPPPFPEGVLDSDNNTIKNHNWVIFSQWIYDLTPKLSFMVGGRYTEDTEGSIPDQFSYANPAAKYIPVQLYEDTFESLIFSGSASYRWTDNIMTYVSYSQDFKGGGWNSNFNQPVPQAVLDVLHTFDEEKAETFEVGFKTDLFNNTLRLNGAWFTTGYTDLQFTFRYGVAPLLANAGEASIDGFELEGTWVPTDHWQVDLGVGYLHDSIDRVDQIDVPGPLVLTTGVTTDSTIPFTPKWSVNFGIGYISDPIVYGLRLRPRVDVFYKAPQFFDAQNTPEIAQLDGITLVNLSLAIENAAGDWRVIASGKYLTDEVYSIGGNSALGVGSGYAEAVFVRGREWFISLAHDF